MRSALKVIVFTGRPQQARKKSTRLLAIPSISGTGGLRRDPGRDVESLT